MCEIVLGDPRDAPQVLRRCPCRTGVPLSKEKLGRKAKPKKGLGEKIEDRVGRDGTEVADHAGGGEAVLGGQHSVEVRQAAPFRRCGRSEEDRDGLHVGVGSYRRVHWDQDGS